MRNSGKHGVVGNRFHDAREELSRYCSKGHTCNNSATDPVLRHLWNNRCTLDDYVDGRRHKGSTTSGYQTCYEAVRFGIPICIFTGTHSSRDRTSSAAMMGVPVSY